jgi:DNA-nicking Smr family endonuclease
MSVADDDSALFLAEMVDVRPLRLARREVLKSAAPAESVLAVRRELAEHGRPVDRNPLSDEPPLPMDPWLVLEFKRPGVQDGVFRKLRLGRYAQEARLDLHRMTVAQARRELFGFIEEARGLSLRTVVIIHGKGRADPTAPVQGSVLKACVDIWLRELPVVQAFHSAQPAHGGTGALYVLLSKSEEAKRINRERFLKGRQ